MLKRLTNECIIQAVFQPPSGGCVLKPFGDFEMTEMVNQPPSGGCVLKLIRAPQCLLIWSQPPSGGCVLKHWIHTREIKGNCQPPSGGCVLKRQYRHPNWSSRQPAAFRRLCVETSYLREPNLAQAQPPSGGCVLKLIIWNICSKSSLQPPSGGCVLKLRWSSIFLSAQ